MRTHRYLRGLAFTGLISSVAVLTLSLAPAAASAATFNSSVSISIDTNGSAFMGKVNSPKAACTRRKVTLERKKKGQTSFTKVGTDTSTATGAWKVSTNPVADAQYRAAIAVSSLNGGNRCKAAESTTTTVRVSVVTIQREGATGFHGSVVSSSVCSANRTVSLQRMTIYQESFGNIGSDATDRFGNWSVNTSVIAGARYRAMVTARQAAANSSCLDAVSSRVGG